ncbi:hypothetical protein BGX31_000165, partial [Mortierella sp. GBA43]
MSGVESLRTVLANHPESSSSRTSSSRRDYHDSSSASSVSESRSGTQHTETGETETTIDSRTGSRPVSGSSWTPSKTRNRSGSWSSLLPPSMLPGGGGGGKRHSSSTISSTISHDSGSTFLSTSTATATTTTSTTTTSHGTPGYQRQGSFREVAESITDSVAESFKNFGTGLKLGHLAEGLGLNGSESGSGPGSGAHHVKRGTADQHHHHHQQQQQQQHHHHHHQHQERGPYMSALAGQASRSRSTLSGDSESTRRRKEILQTGVKPEDAAKEIATLLARQRKQQDLAMERAKRMPELEKMTQ